MDILQPSPRELPGTAENGSLSSRSEPSCSPKTSDSSLVSPSPPPLPSQSPACCESRVSVVSWEHGPRAVRRRLTHPPFSPNYSELEGDLVPSVWELKSGRLPPRDSRSHVSWRLRLRFSCVCDHLPGPYLTSSGIFLIFKKKRLPVQSDTIYGSFIC